MAEIFGRTNYDEDDVSGLEDEPESETPDETFVVSKGLYKLRLIYSSEGVYAESASTTQLADREKVIVHTRYGLDLAENLGQARMPVGIRKSDIVRIERKATKDDIQKAETLAETEKKAQSVFCEKVSQLKLDMKFIAVHFLVGEPKVVFFFASENRVDFRELVKELVSVFRMRIELRQVSAREECRITGGMGICGRPYCCHSVSDKLRPVSIKMAKEQNLSLNSMKISGQCGRLLCCLSYEHDWYAEARKKLPLEGVRLFYDETNFKVIETNPLSLMVKMVGEDGRVLEVNAKRFVHEGGKWKITG